MAMKKYTKAESFDIVRGKQASVMNQFFQRVGKFSVSDLTEEERTDLKRELDEAGEE